MGNFRVSSFLDNSSYYIGIYPQVSDKDAETSKVCAAKTSAALEKQTP